MTAELVRIAAFTNDPLGGNPAGVWIGAVLPDSATMQRIAAEVGYSETAFLAPDHGWEREVRYFSPLAEVSFCGHATIAAGVVLGSRSGHGTYRFHTAIGDVPVEVRERASEVEAELTSVEPRHEAPRPTLVADVLSVLGWRAAELDPEIPPTRIYAGAWHLLLAAGRPERLANLAYDFDRLKSLMLEDRLTTVQLIWREGPSLIHARNPFPVGGVVEDPATGAAAAALGGYLRARGLVTPPTTVLVRQGDAMGRPSRLRVTIPIVGGIRVAGTAVHIPGS